MTAKVLVTGASGFLGSRLARRLLDEGYQLSLLVRPAAVLDATLKSQCHIVYGDLSDQNALALAVSDCEWIFHCAANVKTWDCIDNYYRTNVLGVQHLLDAVQQNTPALKRFVHISTVDVYGYPDAPADESSPVRKTGFGYGDSKLEGEQRVLRMASDHDLPFTIIRPGNIIGPGSQFISEIGTALKTGNMLTIEGGLAHAGLIDVDNLVDLILWAADSDIALNEIYNARDETEMNWREYLSQLQRVLDASKPIRDLSFPTAMLLARTLEWVFKLIRTKREPPLHRLLVCMFGKTCGHSADKIRRHSDLPSRIAIEKSIQRSAQWFLENTVPD
ncbi:NAD-dependent epimerase/dehydratase family protein [Litorivivens sp.]|uniref:NAD-dependent epimerase/dehydratase family protein n=1 Tax=Litorivivens sp. TaxID=2020868 RepID=UPI003561592F